MDGLNGDGWMARRKEGEEMYYKELLHRGQDEQEAFTVLQPSELSNLCIPANP